MKVLVAPLDWGLGHATRCVPVIRALLAQGCRVVLGASGKPLAFLRSEFPALEWIEIPSVEIRYQQRGSFLLKVAAQIPSFLSQIKAEQQWLKENASKLEIDAVVSDNRYGIFLKGKPSVLITHQLFPSVPWFLRAAVRNQVRRWTHPFTRIWVPDAAGEPNLSGRLSHGRAPKQTVYIGPLSRFRRSQAADVKYEYLGMVSGPEPQRTLFQQKLIDVFMQTGKPAAVVCGLPGEGEERLAGHVRIIPHLASEELQQLIAQSRHIVCRSGYSTVMDLCAMGRTALLVPTPGQTEQEYLAVYLSKQKLFGSAEQNAITVQSLDVEPLSLPALSTSSALDEEVKKLVDLMKN